LYVYAPRNQLWKNLLQLAIAHQGIAADNRDVQRPVFLHDLHEALDQRLSAEIRQLAQSDAPAEVLLVVGVAARTAQRALACNLDGQKGLAALKDSPPSLNNFNRLQDTSAFLPFGSV
jgi:G:T/U-mismatch repair DNA glycosylase